MKSLKKIVLVVAVLLGSIAVNAQIKNSKTATVKILGNCGMCKKNIENAGNSKKVALVNWNADSKMATLTYDATKTNPDEILKRIAEAGYENEKFTANEEQYHKLNTCCQYDRTVVNESKKATKK